MTGLFVNNNISFMLVMYAAYASEDMAAGEFGRGLTSILRSR